MINPRIPAAAACLALPLTVLAGLVLATGVGAGPRAQALDHLRPVGAVDPRLLVVAGDRAFFDRVRANPIDLLMALYAMGDAETVLVDQTAVDVGHRLFAASEFDVRFSTFGSAPNTPFLLPLDNVELTAAGSDQLPRLHGGGISSTLAAGASTVGFPVSDQVAGPDHVVRAVPLAARRPDAAAAAAADVGAGVPLSQPLIAWLRAEDLPPDLEVLPGRLRVGARELPVEDYAQLRVRYDPALLAGGPNVVSAARLLDGSLPAEQLRGKTIVFGMTDPGTTRQVAVPAYAGGRAPAVYLQANTVNTLLTGSFVRPTHGGITLAGVASTTAAVTVLALLLPLWAVPLPCVLLAASWVGFAVVRANARQLIDIVLVPSAVAVAVLAVLGLRAAQEIVQRRRLAALFAEYVPAAVARQLVAEGRAQDAAAGQRLQVTVLFCDLRGFTPLAARLAPAQVRELLDLYYERVSERILRHGGTVMQYVGDEVFAVFGAPLPSPTHAADALACTQELLALEPSLAVELAGHGLPAITYGIGVHTGEVVAAHVGSPIRRQYSIVGDTVNIGSRLCSQAPPGTALLSAAFTDFQQLPLAAEPVTALTLKGVPTLVRAHRLRRPYS